MVFCQNCGAQLSEGTKFCPSCGTPVQAVETPEPVQQEAVPVIAAAPAPEPVQVATPAAVMEKEPVPQQPEPQQPAYQQPAPQQPVYQQPAPQQSPYQQTIPGNPLTEEQAKKGLAILAYFGILFLIPLFAAKKGSFARYHANQSLVLFIFMVVFNVLSTVLGNILVNISPLLTLVVTGVFSLLVLVLCVFALIGIIHAAKGQRKPVPIIGGITIIK